MKVDLSKREIAALVAAVEATSGKPGFDFEALGEAACSLLEAKDRIDAGETEAGLTKADCLRVVEIFRDWNVDQIGNISGGHESVSILNNRRRLLRAATKRLADIADGTE